MKAEGYHRPNVRRRTLLSTPISWLFSEPTSRLKIFKSQEFQSGQKRGKSNVTALYQDIVLPLVTEPTRWTYVRDWVAPTLNRLRSPKTVAGRGVTIAMIDAGFYPHPDLVLPENRILLHVDVTVDGEPLDGRTDAGNWHGTMTSVVAAGNGYLGQGVYRGPAYMSKLILIKAGENLSIRPHNVARALKWIHEHHEEYGIRVVNISLGVGETDRTSENSVADFWVKKCFEAGLNIVVAAGNSGGNVGSPAKCKEAITVGGYFDHCDEMFNSDYGFTPEKILKPDIIAPSALLASPILPGTPQQKRAAALARLVSAPESLSPELLKDSQLPDGYEESKTSDQIDELQGQIAGNKVVGTYYEHVDGTSVAAPLVSATIAQMLEIQPSLSNKDIRQILLQTSERLSDAPAEKQGRGVLKADLACNIARVPEHILTRKQLGATRSGDHLYFRVYAPEETSVSIAGDFTQWEPKPLESQGEGLWELDVALPLADSEKRAYKYLFGSSRWEEDRHNPYCESDGVGGLNSLVDRKLLLLQPQIKET